MISVFGKRKTVVIFFLFVAALDAAQTSVEPQQAAHNLSKKEVKWLLKNARTASDHRQLAAYYREQAERLTQRSKEHQELADAYANRIIFEPKTGFPGGLARHCCEFAIDLAESAKDVQSLAEMHDKLANEAQRN